MGEWGYPQPSKTKFKSFENVVVTVEESIPDIFDPFKGIYLSSGGALWVGSS